MIAMSDQNSENTRLSQQITFFQGQSGWTGSASPVMYNDDLKTVLLSCCLPQP